MALAPLLGSQLTGPRTILAINGIPISWASGISISDARQHDEMRTLGSFEVVEFVPTSYGAQFSAQTFALITENAYTIGIAPQMGETPAQHLLNVLSAGSATVTVSDAKTSKLLWTLYGFKYSGSSSSPSPNSMTMSDISAYVTRAVPFGAA